MAISEEFRIFVEEICTPLGPVNIRPMFGGAGVYHDSVMIALIADETLYLKVDDQSRPAFDEAGSEPFVYEGKGKPIAMSYVTLPEEALDDPDAALNWLTLASEAPRRAQAVKARRSRRRKNGRPRPK